ncbi:DUF1929-domain-containing protein [Tricholoma matsutake]|nr:DUF1929-domain-containing protein [Tricholoma matsutake 945]
MLLPLSLIALWLAPVFAVSPGSFSQPGPLPVSAMMMFLGNEETVYILDKAEGNAAQINGHPAWGAAWDINTYTSTVMDVRTNTFCASGMHLPNGSYVTFGGNGAIGRGGKIGSQLNPSGTGAWDSVYQDFDGSRSIRIINPCSSANLTNQNANCQWFDDPSLLSMQKQRWYSTAEALPDGTIVMIGGFVNGGYINRNFPNTDPAYEGGAAEPTYEFFPANGRPPQVMQFMIKTSGLNAYAHAFLMSSGKMLVQANYSTVLWDVNANVETPLPDMPGPVIRVYPASGAVAMLPLTPANNYTPTILFCGGSDMPDQDWGNYASPAINTWEYPASSDCQRLTPEPADGSAPVYEQDDNMLQGRSMGQFIILPDGKLLVINGGQNGTAGYSSSTPQTPSPSDMPYGMSLASGPVGQPAIYDPTKPKGQRWSNTGLGTSQIARLYHSSAILLPDASVLIAGSNPNVDVNLTTIFPTEYRAEIFYPSYFQATTRPAPTGMPNTISYGGNPFDITIPPSSYSGSANDAASNATVVLLRGGFTTHAMNMGQRFMQLNNTYTVHNDSFITLHCAQAYPNPNLLQPGPALLFVTISGIPSNGTMVIVGNGQIGPQPTSPPSVLPASVRVDSASGSANGANHNTGNGNSTSSGSTSHTGTIIGAVVGAISIIGILGALVGVLISRRRRAAASASTSAPYPMTTDGGGRAVAGVRGMRSSDSSAFVPLQQENRSHAWNESVTSLAAPYKDYDGGSGRGGSAIGMSMDYDPYSREPMGQGIGQSHRY